MPVVGELLPIALGVVVSPIAIAVVIALLMTRGASLTGSGFVLGWAVGLFALVLAFTWLSAAVGFTGARARPVLAVIELAAAGLAVALAAVQFFGRRGLAARSLRGLDEFRMPQAAVLGFAGSVLGPKIILLAGVAGATIAASGGAAPVWTAAAVFALVGSIGVALPVVAYAVARGRAAGPLARARAWITRHDRAASAVSLLIVAVVLVLDATVSRS